MNARSQLGWSHYRVLLIGSMSTSSTQGPGGVREPAGNIRPRMEFIWIANYMLFYGRGVYPEPDEGFPLKR